MSKLIRPALLPDGSYFIGRFLVKVEDQHIVVNPAQFFTHSHQQIDELRIDDFDATGGFAVISIIKGRESKKAQKRLNALFASKDWKPAKVKAK